ncbi:triple tyrosine motif-containing protein [Psychroflexus salinarum]|uniref:Triple tyrosine motif-containing protein n=1 Tax=Psychroflexus salinarum TaxID=546024 RepID=A0ABW3GSY3_9FLAO
MKNLRTFGINPLKYSLIYLALAFCFALGVKAQELPPVITFSPKDYQADNQNWSITQGENKHIYVANNKGLLEHDGETWNLYPSPNQSILRSVFYHDDKIYSGSYREFGFWENQPSGELKYHSLSNDIIDSIGTDEQFWKIDRLEKWIIFQSLDHIYTYNYDDQNLKKVIIDGSITKMYKLGNDLFFQIANQGLYKIQDGNPVLVSDHPIFRENLIINLYKHDTEILVQTDTKGIFTLENSPKQWPQSYNKIQDLSVYTSLQTKSGKFILGTISQGVVFLNRDGSLDKKISQQEALYNNTVLSIFEDKDKNIWLGLDNGINCVNVDSPISVYKGDRGILGTVYASAIFEDKLFLGTNQGLFTRPLDDASANFTLVEGSSGQVWSLNVVDGDLLCGHNNGTFSYSNNQFNQISNIIGTWCFKPIPNNPNLILQGHYKGMSILEKKSGTWSLRNSINGFDVSSKFIEFVSPTEVLIDHEYKGVYKVTLNENYSEVENIYQFENFDKGLYSSLTKFKNSVYYAQRSGVWEYKPDKNEFVRNSLLSKLYSPSTYSSGKLASTAGEIGLWSFNKNSIDFTLQGKIDEKFRLASIPITSDTRETMAGYENVYQLDKQHYLMGSTQGYLVIDIDKFFKTNIDKTLKITTIKFKENGGIYKALDLEASPNLKNKFNNIYFNFSIPYFQKYFASEYQYKLKGFLDEWSGWKEEHEATFSNLPSGDYEFQVRARVGDLYQTETQSYSFTIKRPFVFSNGMIVLYILLLLITILLIHNAYRRYYKKQKNELKRRANRELELKELESQKQLINVKNEQLQQDIDNKSRELAVSTMSLIKKNEFLGSIKDELQKEKPLSKSSQNVIKIINKNINNTDDWRMFEEAFNNSDKDFLKTMKSKHPSLTPNDLKLCAYLRLNLSSKEIAPLFNISTKSVEVKRYRLRKKMSLPREVGLTDYILEI